MGSIFAFKCEGHEFESRPDQVGWVLIQCVGQIFIQRFFQGFFNKLRVTDSFGFKDNLNVTLKACLKQLLPTT